MPRINFSVTDDLYKQIEEKAQKRNVSVNSYVYNIIVKQFCDSDFDLLDEFENLIKEADSKEGDFSLNDLDTFKNLDDKLKETNYPENVKQVKTRLGMMFQDTVKNNVDYEVNNVMTISRDGKEVERTSHRMKLYSAKLQELSKGKGKE
ncbi:hypothetical protein SAMN04487760_10524 [Lachnospiraceae bacterium G41]|nr:hypothetical protein SAMN04487760_10524 [Lachnospiraceae bacterium G41]